MSWPGFTRPLCPSHPSSQPSEAHAGAAAESSDLMCASEINLRFIENTMSRVPHGLRQDSSEYQAPRTRGCAVCHVRNCMKRILTQAELSSRLPAGLK